MTDDSTSPGGLTNDEAEPTPPDFTEQKEGVDWFLALLIGHAMSYGMEMGITLTVGGRLITGFLISGKKYFEGIQELTAQAAGDGDSAPLNEAMAEVYSRLSEIHAAPDASRSAFEAKPDYIHLRDARIVDFPGTMPNNGTYWRGKLTDVSGFMLGTIDH